MIHVATGFNRDPQDTIPRDRRPGQLHARCFLCLDSPSELRFFLLIVPPPLFMKRPEEESESPPDTLPPSTVDVLCNESWMILSTTRKVTASIISTFNSTCPAGFPRHWGVQGTGRARVTGGLERMD